MDPAEWKRVMSRFIPYAEMTTEDIYQCSAQARAIISLCESASWAIQNGGPADVLADSIGCGLRLALELLEPVHDTTEFHQRRRAKE